MDIEDFSLWANWAERPSVEYPGVYVLAISQTNLKNVPFSWIRPSDFTLNGEQLENGVVYIGMTNAGLRGRLNQFDTTIKHIEKTSQHGGADRFRRDYRDYAQLKELLYVSVRPFECDTLKVIDALIAKKDFASAANSFSKMGDVAKAEYEYIAQFIREFHRRPKYNDRKNSPKHS